MAKKAIKTNLEKNQAEKNNILAISIDFVAIFLLVSILHLVIISILGISPSVLLKQGIETSIFEQRMNTIAYLGFCYIATIIVYFIFLRKYFSLGEKIFKK